MANFIKLERRLNLPVVLALNANVIIVVSFSVIPKIAHLKHLFFWEWIETFSRQSQREDNKVLVFPSWSSFYKDFLSRITGKNESSGGQINSSGNQIKWQSLFPQFIPSWYLCHPYIISSSIIFSSHSSSLHLHLSVLFTHFVRQETGAKRKGEHFFSKSPGDDNDALISLYDAFIH